MRRHPALVPLSEEHHYELAHASRLLRAAGAGPEQRLAAASAYVDAFFTETVEHFRREEEILFPLYVRHAGSTPVLVRILREHMELHGLVRALRIEAAAGEIPPEALKTIGDLLHDHVRVEEHELLRGDRAHRAGGGTRRGDALTPEAALKERDNAKPRSPGRKAGSTSTTCLPTSWQRRVATSAVRASHRRRVRTYRRSRSRLRCTTTSSAPRERVAPLRAQVLGRSARPNRQPLERACACLRRR